MLYNGNNISKRGGFGAKYYKYSIESKHRSRSHIFHVNNIERKRLKIGEQSQMDGDTINYKATDTKKR